MRSIWMVVLLAAVFAGPANAESAGITVDEMNRLSTEEAKALLIKQGGAGVHAAGECAIEGLVIKPSPTGRFLYFEGSSTCERGTIHARIYDAGNQLIAIESSIITGYIFWFGIDMPADPDGIFYRMTIYR